MSEPLATYLQDHLAGAQFAIKLLENLQDQHTGEALEEFAAELLEDVRQDREILEGILQRVGGGDTGSSKDIFAWFGEKATRLKLHRRSREGLGTLQKLETLALGIQGKLSLWKALAEVAGADARLRDIDFQDLARRAEAQHAQAEARRLEAARAMFAAARPAR